MISIAASARTRHRRDFARALSYFGLIALIFAQYITTAIPAYLLLILSLLVTTNIRLPVRIVLYLCALVCYWIAVVGFGFGKNLLTHFLFYFGFLVPWLVIAGSKRIQIENFADEKAIIGLCLLTILETVLFNSPVAERLYFFPSVDSQDRAGMFGFYQRPMGIAGNPSMTSGVLFFLVILNERLRGVIKPAIKVLVGITTMLLASGTGFGLFLLYLGLSLFRSHKADVKYVIRGAVYVLIIAICLAAAFGYFGEFENFDKFTYDYFVLMYEFKIYTLQAMIENTNLERAFFGNQIIPDFVATTGDSALLVTPYAIGGLGAALLFIAPLLYPRGILRNLVPTVFFYASFIHYPGLLTPPGQVLFACYLRQLARTNSSEVSRRVPAIPGLAKVG